MHTSITFEDMRMSIVDRASVGTIRSGIGRYGVDVRLPFDAAHDIRRGADPMNGLAVVVSPREAMRLAEALMRAAREALETEAREHAWDRDHGHDRPDANPHTS